jgi:hypothetical protein
VKRQVYIELHGDSWRVLYFERRFRGRYQAACFYAKDTTRERVVEWVKGNNRLQLVDKDGKAVQS